jgi:aryl-alcohol dehydrogenase-like predicted oxidoreductase
VENEMSDLPERKLGNTGLEVTSLGYGAMEMRAAGSTITKDEASRVLNAVLDAGRSTTLS